MILVFENVLPTKFFNDSKDKLGQKRWKMIRKKLQEINSMLPEDNQDAISREILDMNLKSQNLVEKFCNVRQIMYKTDD